MLTRDNLWEYQQVALDHMGKNSDSMLWLGCGLGKTITTLTNIVDRIQRGEVKRVLLFGPVRVITSVWAKEARNWEHTKHLRFSLIHGTPQKRSRALFSEADVHLCNYENMSWLSEQLQHYYISQGKPLPYDMVVYDEVSKMKNSNSLRVSGGIRDRGEERVRVHGWRPLIPHFKYRVGLTGTPASNGYLDLFGQFLAVDGGQRLGEYVTHYKDSYFKSDYMGWGFEVTDLGKDIIEKKISDITIKMDSKDYLDMPDVKVVNMMVDIPPKARNAYEEMEAHMFTELDNGSEVEVFSRSSVTNKLLQFCNGSPYLSSDSDEFEKLHDAKLDALEEVLEEAAGQPVLCSYSFKADAARIMKRFKKYKPVNLTEEKASKTAGIIKKWNDGKLKLLIGHPACLHPSTEVLTERRGWVKMVDVKNDDRVHDGVEYVNHDGCSHSGYREVINVFGITMTPDHKLLIDGEWVEARNVKDIKDAREKALHQHEVNAHGSSGVHEVQYTDRDDQTECRQAQSIEKRVLQSLCERSLSRQDRYSHLAYLVRNEKQVQGYERSELRWPWYKDMQRMGGLYQVLQRHARRLRRPLNNRKKECKQRVLKGQLHLGDNVQSTRQQEEQSSSYLSWGRNTLSRIVSSFRGKQDDVNHEIKQRDVTGTSSRRCKGISVRKESEPGEHTQKKKTHVFDLVNCGPRSRFLIRNNKGEVFVSHNSMGHGIDGLQKSGNILIWFGMNWSLELYEQMNARLNRQGQTKPVSIIRILCNDTVDLAVADAIERKTDDEAGLKRAIERYRKGITTNDLEVNFF